MYWLYYLYDKDIVLFEGCEKNDVLVNLFKLYGYEYYGFIIEYDILS